VDARCYDARVPIVDLTARRLKRLEKGQAETNALLAGMSGSMGHVVEVLEAHSRHFERMEEAMIGIAERVDRLTAAIARGRTQDLARFDDHERRLRALERPGRPRRGKR
jgi:hypothetical protein